MTPNQVGRNRPMTRRKLGLSFLFALSWLGFVGAAPPGLRVILVVVGFVFLAMASWLWGADSRESYDERGPHREI